MWISNLWLNHQAPLADANLVEEIQLCIPIAGAINDAKLQKLYDSLMENPRLITEGYRIEL